MSDESPVDRPMGLEAIATAAMRLGAIWFILHSIGSFIATSIFMVLYGTKQLYDEPVDWDNWLSLIFDFLTANIVSFIMFLWLALAFWILAPRVGRLVVRGLDPRLPFSRLGLPECYSIGFVCLGIYVLAVYSPNIISFIRFFATAEPDFSLESVYRENLFAAAQFGVRIAFGVLLIIYGRRWASALARFHERREPTPSGP